MQYRIALMALAFASVANAQVILTTIPDSPTVQAQYDRLGIIDSPVPAIYAWWIDRDADARFDEGRIRDYVATRPDWRDAPRFMLDWEGATVKIIKAGPAHPRFADTAAEFRKAIAESREYWPDAQAHWWGEIPHANWGFSDEYIAGQEAWADLLLTPGEDNGQADAIAPSVYMFGFADAEQRDRWFEKSVRPRIELALRKGIEYDVPVYVYTAVKYHFTSPHMAAQRIPREIHVEHLRRCLAVEVEGRKPDGVIAWGSNWYWQVGWQKKRDGSYRFPAPAWDTRRASMRLEFPAIAEIAEHETSEVMPEDPHEIHDLRAFQVYWDRRTIDFYDRIREAVGPVEEPPPPPPPPTDFKTILLVTQLRAAIAEAKAAIEEAERLEEKLLKHVTRTR